LVALRSTIKSSPHTRLATILAATITVMLLRVDSRLGLGGGGFGEVGAGGARSPRGAVNEEEDQQGEEGSDGVEEGIPGRGGAGGDEGLVDFVKGRISSSNEPGEESPRPAPAGAFATNAAVEQQIENEILREMGAFADEVVK